MDGEDFCLPIKLGLEISKWIMNKYYNLTDESEIYWVSISMLIFLLVVYLTILVLHPGLKTWYFKDNKWPQDWQDKVLAITQRIFENEYQDSHLLANTSGSSIITLAQGSSQVSKTNNFIYYTYIVYRQIPSIWQCAPKC